MSLALAPLGMLYGALARTRLRLYRYGLLKTETAGVPVISVGNLTTGGTGKTPLVEWVARAVKREGLRACVLTRGYGRADESVRVVASDGVRVLAEVGECGDEPRLLAERLLGTASVVCDRDRVAAARWARENLGAEVFILDDGFQHLRMGRDLDVVTLDASAPWSGGHMLPRGRLREPVSGLRRADCVVITRAELAADLEALRAEVSRLCDERVAVLVSRVRTRGLMPLGAAGAGLEDAGVSLEEDELIKVESRGVEQPVAAFCAVGNPRAFFEHLRRDGFELCHTRAFPDHHAYTASDVEAIAREAVRCGARSLLTTAKDAVKLRGRDFALPCYVVETVLEFEDEGRLLDLIRNASGVGRK
ncbi:MAG: tetraacyldisaccharide 4-kinase [Acidobacteriota bacterium]|jgi:tetraacyldisaccharide 4'-kinase|nr:tetraacyldisaccharide 4-kinase [Acidobacteriota bacterium]